MPKGPQKTATMPYSQTFSGTHCAYVFLLFRRGVLKDAMNMLLTGTHTQFSHKPWHFQVRACGILLFVRNISRYDLLRTPPVDAHFCVRSPVAPRPPRRAPNNNVVGVFLSYLLGFFFSSRAIAMLRIVKLWGLCQSSESEEVTPNWQRIGLNFFLSCHLHCGAHW